MSSSIRLATGADSAAILSIYAPYVKETAITFETEVPSREEFSARIEAIAAFHPYLVYEQNGEIVGYAYASKFQQRAAYRYNAELSIYVAPACHGSGVAKALYACLLHLLEELGYYNVYALYTLPNPKSARFHEKFGFRLIGVHHKTGYKLGAWQDVAWADKALREHPDDPGEVKSIKDLPAEYLAGLFAAYAGA